MIEFIEKHKKLEYQKRATDLANEQRSSIMENKTSEGVIKARIKMKTEQKLKAMNVMKKHELLEKRVKYVKIMIQAIKKYEDAEREKMYKNEITFLKDDELKYNLMKQNKIHHYNIEKNIEKMDLRNGRVEEFK